MEAEVSVSKENQMRPPTPLTRSVSLRWRVTLLAASVVAVVVAIMAFSAYAVVSQALYRDIDSQLRSRSDALISSGVLGRDPRQVIQGTAYSSDISVLLIIPSVVRFSAGTSVPYGEAEKQVVDGVAETSLRTTEGQRVLAQRMGNGSTLIIAKQLKPTGDVLTRLAWVLLVVGSCGIVLAGVAGTIVARTGLRPVARLTAAAERIARTDDLDPIPVTGSDELARLAEGFNTMLRALAESRDRQSRLVADAGHELRTPLTSLRTNMELLIASSAPGSPAIPESDMAELRQDVIAQIEEMSTLVGDLVDLAREDGSETIYEQADLSDIVERSIERVRRRRNDIDITAQLVPWWVFGDSAGLSRAVLNVLDNAAKWSPTGGQVLVNLVPIDPYYAELTVVDAGPGIPLHERNLVFDRFYRSTASRSMPGSGLGLAIVKQVVIKHGGTIEARDAHLVSKNPSGTCMRIVLPGKPNPARASRLEG
ncbi:MAG: ATP-binding protein [Mycobacteriaceae bacterium]